MEPENSQEGGFREAMKPVLLVLVGLVAILIYAAVMLFPSQIVYLAVMALGVLIFVQIMAWGR